jgi:membrane protein DedA with SNARE-associated domain
MLQYLLIALATLGSEDLASIGAGMLAAERRISLTGAILAAAIGIWAGDVMLLAVGRIAGRRLLERWVPEERVVRARDWLEARGFWAILGSRFVPGLRLPMYLIAGSLPSNPSRFALYLLIAAAIWTPVLVSASSLAGARGALQAQNIVLRIVAAAFAVGGARWLLQRFSTTALRKRIAARIRRVTAWEFWPVWAAYLPVVPWLLLLSIRYRSPRVFLCANPGIPLSGLVGESKSAILAHLRKSGRVAPYVVVERLAPPQVFPVVAKPDVGERGRGVRVIRSRDELLEYLRNGTKTILQQYVPGLEFGVLYYRDPRTPVGRIVSITEKRFPEVTGDGLRSVRQLILDDARAAVLERAYLAGCRRNPDDVPLAGERVPLVEIGSHCRGAMFLDASNLATPELENAVDAVARCHPGFYIGRFDVRTPSIEAFQNGEFTVLELNGVAGEPAHIYDPRVSLFSAYAAMFRHWSFAAAAGAANLRRGNRPESWRHILRTVTA